MNPGPVKMKNGKMQVISEHKSEMGCRYINQPATHDSDKHLSGNKTFYEPSLRIEFDAIDSNVEIRKRVE